MTPTTTYGISMPFYEGLATIRAKGKQWGFIDETGELVIPLEYEKTVFFSEGFAAVRKNGKWGAIDKTGKPFIPFIYDWVFCFYRGIGIVMKNGKYGLIDKTGKELLKSEYDEIRSDFLLHLDEGYIAVKKDGRWGFVKLNFPLPPPPSTP
jgi:hypothetical protein